MYKIFVLLIICSLPLLFISCGSAQVTLFNQDVKYPPTNHIDIYTDLNTLHKDYIEIGYVSAEGGKLTSQQRLLTNMIEKAKQAGADALIKVRFGSEPDYNEVIGYQNKPIAKAVMIKYKN